MVALQLYPNYRGAWHMFLPTITTYVIGKDEGIMIASLFDS
jgi:hypothetical protein